jgi:hypothetical protein
MRSVIVIMRKGGARVLSFSSIAFHPPNLGSLLFAQEPTIKASSDRVEGQFSDSREAGRLTISETMRSSAYVIGVWVVLTRWPSAFARIDPLLAKTDSSELVAESGRAGHHLINASFWNVS